MSSTLKERPQHVDAERVVDFDFYADRRYYEEGDIHRALYRMAEEEGRGIFWTPRNGGHWFINDHAMLFEAVRNVDLFSSAALTLPPMPEGQEPRVLPVSLDGERPAQVPSVQAALRGGWEDRGRLASLAVRYIGEQDESEGDPEPLPDAWVVDAVGRWPIKGRLSLDLRAENLFDAKLITSILADGTRERGTPRTLWIGLRLD